MGDAGDIANIMPKLKDQWRRLRNKLKRGKMVRLPVELHLLIIEQVERQEDLYNLLFVSRAFNLVAQRVIYRDIHLKSRKGQLQLFQTIILHEHIAHSIQSLTISSIPHHDDKAYWNTLFQVLCATRNLKKLCWEVSDVSSARPLPMIFSNCTFQLHTLVFHAWGFGTVIPDPAFLNLQTELVVLDTPDLSYSTITPNAFPKLTTLTVSCPMTAQLINNPTLRAVYLPYLQLITGPWPSSRLVTSLRLDYPRLSPGDFSRILRAYPCLRFLRIDHFVLPHPSVSPTWEQGVEYIFTQLAHLIALEKLILHFEHRVWWKGVMRIRHTAFRSLKSLQWFAVQEHETYVQLRRGAKDPETTGRDEGEWRSERWQ